jgi:hypothetical protein
MIRSTALVVVLACRVLITRCPEPAACNLHFRFFSSNKVEGILKIQPRRISQAQVVNDAGLTWHNAIISANV